MSIELSQTEAIVPTRTYFLALPPNEWRSAEYQRHPNQLRVEKIVANFRPELLDPPFLSFRDGSYFIVDGRHRQEALTAMEKEKLPVMCQVVEGLNYQQEARLFAERNSAKNRLVVDQDSLLRAMIESTDKWSIAFHDTVHSVGLIFPYEDGGHHDNPKALRAIKTAQKIARLFGFEHLKGVLTIMRDSWEEGSKNYDQRMLNGMSLFVRRHASVFDRDRLITRMGATNYEVLHSAASMYQTSRNISSTEGMVRAIEACYNKYLKDQEKILQSIGG